MKKVISKFETTEIKTIRGKRYRVTKEVTKIEISTTQLRYKERPMLTEGVRMARHGYPYEVVKGKGARFVSFKDAFVSVPKLYTVLTKYYDFETKIIGKDKIVEKILDKMIMHIYSLRNKSRGKATKIRRIVATIECYYPLDKLERVDSYRTLEKFVSKSDYNFMLHKFDVEGDEVREVDFDERKLFTYDCVIRDEDYGNRIVDKESGVI